MAEKEPIFSRCRKLGCACASRRERSKDSLDKTQIKHSQSCVDTEEECVRARLVDMREIDPSVGAKKLPDSVSLMGCSIQGICQLFYTPPPPPNQLDINFLISTELALTKTYSQSRSFMPQCPSVSQFNPAALVKVGKSHFRDL